jgi:hypothetical protein
VYEPAEARFLASQADLEKEASRVFDQDGPQATERFLNEYARRSMTHVGAAYDELVDYLLFQHLVGWPELAPSALPQIASPAVRDVPLQEAQR